MTQRTLVGLVAVVALITGVIGALYIAPPDSNINEPAQTTSFRFYPAPRALSEFQLTTQYGETLTQDSLKEQWTLVFLGYTFCPDICPTTMAGLNRVYSQIQAVDSEYPVKVLFISVDPKRDSVERLKEYTGFFNKEFIAATGEHKYLFPLTRSMGMMYAMAESTDNPNYLVDHSGSIVVINPQAQVVGRFKPQATPGKLTVVSGEDIVADLPSIVSP